MSNKLRSVKKGVVMNRSISESILLLFPILLIVIVLPLIVKMKTYNPHLSSYDWYAAQEERIDFFLYYKQWFFVGICGLIVLIISIRAFIDKATLRFCKTLIPLFLYSLLALLSTLFSKYRMFGFTGMFEQFENVFCLIGYVLVVYYIFLVIQSDAELTLMVNAIAIGALLVGIIGTFQAFGLDIFNSTFGRELILEKGVDPNSIKIEFEAGRVYATLYNPNYVGVYTAIMIPLFTTMLLFSRHLKQYIFYSLVVITSAISMFGSQSKASIISIVVAFVIAFIMLRKVLWKKKYITLSIVFILGFGFIAINLINDNAFIKAIANAFDSTSTPSLKLTSINTTKENIEIEYDGNTLYAEITEADDLILHDQNKSVVTYDLVQSEENGYILQILDTRFSEIIPYKNYNSDEDITFYIDGYSFSFIKPEGSGTYLYYNRYGRYSPINTMDSSIFSGHERFASGRGFIWGRAIPLLKENILLGTGADSFIHAFPQYDYVSYINYGYGGILISKPHSYYLQVGVQTGLLSLISLLVFFGIYLVQSLSLYINNKFTTVASKIGLSIFIAVISFLISSISNDSSISVSPLFWAIIGIGFTTNMFEKKKS